MTLDNQKIRQDFPALDQRIHDGVPLVYLDNAATTLKPRQVAQTVYQHYLTESANIHRGVHYLSEQATDRYEAVRQKVKNFINARSKSEIIFTSGTTASINLIARSLAQKTIRSGDEILITHMEHHSNIVPWQMIAEQTGCRLKVAPINDRGELIFEEFEKLLTSKTKLVSVVHISNSLGTINPIERIIASAHAEGVLVLIDAAQTAAHLPIDVTKLDCDFLAFSAHKLLGPTGVGVLYGKQELLEDMPPVIGGGDMILSVTFEKTIYNNLPAKFEAGTPHIAGVIGLGTAIDYVESVGLENIAQYEDELLKYATDRLAEVPGIRFIGTAENKAAIISFLVEDVHPHDIGSILDMEGIAIRAGHHCTQPVMQRFNVPATARASFSFYNNQHDVDTLVNAIRKVKEVFV
ncbi:MAG: cysteine desulfurase [Planctomycetes bacterium]|nr:cysteine desulfurase [Planctomycetota bacterium]